MKSILISAIIGLTTLAIHGVTGYVVPVKTIKRLDLTGSQSQGIEKANVVPAKRANTSTMMVPVTVATAAADDDDSDDIEPADDTDDDTATTCVHTSDGYIECGDVMSTRSDIPTPSLAVPASLKLPTRNDRIMPRGVPIKQRFQYLSNPKPKFSKRQNGGCNGKITDAFVNDPDFAAKCNQEIVKGSVQYKKAYPGIEWNTTMMGMCFVKASCDGGDAFDSGDYYSEDSSGSSSGSSSGGSSGGS